MTASPDSFATKVAPQYGGFSASLNQPDASARNAGGLLFSAEAAPTTIAGMGSSVSDSGIEQHSELFGVYIRLTALVTSSKI